MTHLRLSTTPLSLPPMTPAASGQVTTRADGMLELAREAARGDLHQASRLLTAIAPRIASVVRVVMGRQNPDVDDVIQQSMIAFMQALPGFRGECHPASYASRIAVRTAVASRRRTRLGESREQRDSDIDLHASTALNPGDELAAERRKVIVRDLLAELPEEQAEALALRVVLGWSLEEVASTTRAPLNTVRSRIRLAKEALRRRIESDPGLLDELEVMP